MTDTGLHARTVVLDYGPDALQFDGSPTVLFDRPGLTLVGWGTAMLVGAREAAELLASIPCDDAVGRLGTGVVALGALPFLNALDGQLIVPRFTMGIDRDADGATHRWATAVGPVEDPLPETDELFDAVIWQYGTVAGDEPLVDVDVTDLRAPFTSQDYADAVAAAVASMNAPDAALVKVVLSRAITVGLSGMLPLSVVLRRMRAHEPNCTIFSMPVPNGTFFGASPELLIAQHGDRISCHPLAGTVARGATARGDADAQGWLAASPKERSEHRYVVDDLSAILGPLCDELSVPAEPSLVAFHSVAHLGTRIEGHLRAPTTVIDLLAAVHPTPAVGGSPRELALATIAAAEPEERDHWAGPVGWVDAAGTGEWMIGIRSALLHAEGDAVSLRAGAGIVAGSDPAAEAEEIILKLGTVLESLVPGGSAHLR
ncbi:MAG TPA: isochorismate synthase [Acidimicrobiales bacterium]|nr:isochorismate synthase [Acidimicrobiales bacterium]